MQENSSLYEINKVLNKIIKNDFKSFLIKAFHILNPGKIFFDSWYIDFIKEHLSALESRKIKRLIVNVPPRCLKSICITVAWPALLLAKNPATRIIAACYNIAISQKHSEDCRRVLNSTWYKKHFPDTKILRGANTKNKFITTAEGFRFATSVGSTLTGEGADFLILDDPITPIQAMSKNERQKVIKWFEQTFISRLNDKKTGVIVLVMQRLHSNDLTDYLLKKGGWSHIKLPAIAEKNHSLKFQNFSYDLKKGELLNPKREGKKEIDFAKKELGSYIFSAQYQQSPIGDKNAFFQNDCIKRYTLKPEFDFLYQSWDCAIKIGKNNDFSVCTTWGVTKDSYYLIDVFRKKLEFLNLKASMVSKYKEYNTNAVLIEDKASGQQVIQELRSETKVPIIGILPSGNKIFRCIQIIGVFESGKVFLPKSSHWLEDFEMELFSFPDTEHDDQVDSLVQFLIWMKKNHIELFNLRRL